MLLLIPFCANVDIYYSPTYINFHCGIFPYLQGGSNLYRGMRRRCLVFEMTGSRRKHLEDISSGSSLNIPESDQTVLPKDNNLLPTRTANDSPRCILPGIGLHLNSIASNLVDHKVVKHESSGRQLIIAPPSGVYGQESITTLSDAPSLENGREVVDDASEAIGFVINEDLSQSQTSPRKKRQVT